MIHFPIRIFIGNELATLMHGYMTENLMGNFFQREAFFD